jgi:hypothetical protein
MCHGVIPQLLGSMPGRRAVSIIRLASAVRTNEAMAGSVSSPRWAQASSNALALISVWSGLKLVRESRDRLQCVLLRELHPLGVQFYTDIARRAANLSRLSRHSETCRPMLSAHIASFLKLIGAQLEETSRGLHNVHHVHISLIAPVPVSSPRRSRHCLPELSYF